MKDKKIFILAIFLGLITAGSIYWYLRQAEIRMQPGQVGRVLVATVNIPGRQEIQAGMYEVREIPQNYIDPRSISRLADLKGLITKDEILPGEQIRRDRLAGPQDLSRGLSFTLAPGMRAVTLAINEVSGLAGLVRPGDRIDVLAILNLNDATGKEISLASTIVQNLQVLAIGQVTGSADQNKNPLDQKTITLAVTPTQAQPLVLASERGSLRLLLRSPNDKSNLKLPVYRMNYFLPAN